jgi:hypothetical protein
MDGNVTRKQLKMFRNLRSGGIPIDEGLLKEREAACCGLVLYQTGNGAENAVYEPGFDETCFLVSIAVANDSNRRIRLAACHLETPWPETNFRWLKYPLGKIPREYTYQHPACGPEGFNPVVVLNHHFARGLTLFPDDSIEGLLIGSGATRVPEQYVDGQGVRMQIVVFDGRGNPYDLAVMLTVQRAKQKRLGPSMEEPGALVQGNRRPSRFMVPDAVPSNKLARFLK